MGKTEPFIFVQDPIDYALSHRLGACFSMLKFNKLTRTNLRKLERGGKINEHGITFERLANGDARFSVNIMVDGQRIHRVIGNESDGTTRTQAEDFIQKIKQDAKEGRLNLPKGRKLALTFKEAAEKYLNKLEVENGKNLKSKRYQLKLHLIPYFGEKLINKICISDIEGYKKQRSNAQALFGIRSKGGISEKSKFRVKKTKVKPGTINRELATLSHVFTKAVEWKWLETKPSAIKLNEEEKSRIIYLTVEQISLLLEKAKQDPNDQIYLYMKIALETPLRRMAVLAIRIPDIDLDRLVIYIQRTKGGSHEQPITNNLANFLKEYLKKIPRNQIWLFPSKTSHTGHTTAIEKPFRRVVESAGLNPKEIVRHTTRHTAITHLVQAGVDLPTVQRISGHKTLEMVVRYSHQNGDHIQAAMSKLEQRYNAK